MFLVNKMNSMRQKPRQSITDFADDFKQTVDSYIASLTANLSLEAKTALKKNLEDAAISTFIMAIDNEFVKSKLIFFKNDNFNDVIKSALNYEKEQSDYNINNLNINSRSPENVIKNNTKFTPHTQPNVRQNFFNGGYKQYRFRNPNMDYNRYGSPSNSYNHQNNYNNPRNYNPHYNKNPNNYHYSNDNNYQNQNARFALPSNLRPTANNQQTPMKQLQIKNEPHGVNVLMEQASNMHISESEDSKN